jgi:hypothetical protein
MFRVVKPFGQLDLVLGLHNTILCIFSIVMFTGVLFAALAGIRSSSLFDVFCDARGEHFGGPIYYWLHVFYISKVVEFLDTLLLILRGRPVTFLVFVSKKAFVCAIDLSLFSIRFITWRRL